MRVEFDVVLSVDGHLFVFHDELLRRTTNGKGSVGLVSAEYLHSLDAGYWYSSRFRGQKIPVFADMLNWAHRFDVDMNIEIKTFPGTSEQTAIAVLSELNQHWPRDKELPLISSFDLQVLKLCRSLSPELPLGLLLDIWDDAWLSKMQDLNCRSLHIHHKHLTMERVQAVKSQGYQILAYTVNRRRLARKLFRFGVDAIFSDYPDLLA